MKPALWLALAAGVLLASCVETQQSTTFLPSGDQAHTAKCSQAPNDCMNKAAATCNGPYQVVSSFSKPGGLFADALAGPVPWYYLTYKCGPSDGAMPTFPTMGQNIAPAQSIVINNSPVINIPAK